MSIQGKSVLVTGGCGFVGSHLAEALVERGAYVTIIDDLSSSTPDNIASISDRVDFHRLDIRSVDFRQFLLLGDFDAIFHFAANAYIPPSIECPEYDYEINLMAPFYLLETLREGNLRSALIVASSAAVYGNPIHIPVSECDPTIPISPYGVSKLATERYLAVYACIYGLRAASLRLFSVYGPRQHKQIVYDFIQKIAHNRHKLEILGDGSQVRDLVYVKDVVQAALLIWDRAPLHGEVYNVAVGTGMSTRQIAEIVADASGCNPQLAYTGSIRPGDCEKWIASVDRIKALGFSPRFSFEEGVRETVEWYHATCWPLV
jgi:UDP-glucose 4-epimerase